MQHNPPLAADVRMRELFDRLVDASASEREAILGASRIGIRDVQTLGAWLASDCSASPLDDAASTWLDGDGDGLDYGRSLLGRHAGPYLLTDVLGRGGSSLVFRATRVIGGLEQSVALKMLHSGLYSDESRRRFRREQAILMQLSHPNIARLLDAGLTDAGVPYIAMEEVDGSDLLAYSVATGLDLRRRLSLLVEVCRAIDAAHRALIVHRDIKPSNVLVTRDGCVKVLDFGIAKTVKDDVLTATQHIVLTPDYAAPEQFAPGLLTTSADVYSLGVLAGELLVGARLEPDALLPDDSPAAVRAAWSSLERDLANILRTATAFEPGRRYVSAGHLAEDIERFLAGEPVAAHPRSIGYRLRKFVARHRALVASTAIFVVCILLSLAFAISQAIDAKRAAVRAGAEAARANSMRDFIFDAFSEAEPTRPHGEPVTVSEVVDRAIERIAFRTAMDPHAQIELRIRLAEVVGSQGGLERSGVLLAQARDDAAAALGRDDPLVFDAERSLERNLYFRGKLSEARAAVERLSSRRAPVDSANEALLLRDSASIAVKLHESGRAVRDATRAVGISEKLGDDGLLRETLKTLGAALLAAGDLPRAAATYERELELSRKRFGEDSDQVSSALSGLSRAYRRLGDVQRAETRARQALAIDRRIYPRDHWVTASHLNALGMVLMEKGDLDGATRAFEESLRIDEKTLGTGHPDVAIALKDVAAVRIDEEDFASAEPLLSKAVRLATATFGAHHRVTAALRADRGYAGAMLGNLPAGAAELDAAIEDLRASASDGADVLARALVERIRISIARGDLESAWSLHGDFVSAIGAENAANHWSARADCLRGELHILSGSPRAAVQSLERCGSALQRLQQADPAMLAEQRLLLATALVAVGDAQRAGPLAADARERLRGLPYPPRRMRDWEARLPH